MAAPEEQVDFLSGMGNLAVAEDKARWGVFDAYKKEKPRREAAKKKSLVERLDRSQLGFFRHHLPAKRTVPVAAPKRTVPMAGTSQKHLPREPSPWHTRDSSQENRPRDSSLSEFARSFSVRSR